MFPVWAEACTGGVVVDVKFKTVVLKGFYLNFCQLSVTFWSLLNAPQLKKKKNRNKSSSDQLCWLFFWKKKERTKYLKKKTDLRATETHNETTYCLYRHYQPTWLPYRETHQHTHTHTLHQQVDRNTHGKNNVTAKTWFTWFRWWQWFEKQKNKKKKWFFFWYVTCANSLLFFLSLEAEPYLSDNIYL